MDDLVLCILEKYGFVNSLIVFIWLCLFASFLIVYISYRNFTKNCVIGKALVTAYIDDKVDEAATIYVRLLDVEDSEVYASRFTGSEKDFAVGTEVEVAYRKTILGYDIRLADVQGKNSVILVFILQLIPLIVLVAFNIFY
ncbi:MAG: hypothetical protein K6F41_03510 [Lachnospira sp.]|nr:hypothetical protein [Lachnospira sp.]